MQIPLTALLLCNDTQALITVECAFQEYGIPTYLCRNSQAAQSTLQHHKFDLMVVDFDEPGASAVADFHPVDARGVPAVIIALATEPAILKQVLSRRIHFTIQKPVLPKLMVGTLKAAYSLIVSEKHTSFRHSVKLKADASILDKNLRRPLGRAVVRDVSYTGLSLHTDTLVPKDATIFVDFELPEEGEEVHTIGKVMWSDAQGQLGMQFRFIAPLEQKSLRTWLSGHCPWDRELEPRMLNNAQPLAVDAEPSAIQ